MREKKDALTAVVTERETDADGENDGDAVPLGVGDIEPDGLPLGEALPLGDSVRLGVGEGGAPHVNAGNVTMGGRTQRPPLPCGDALGCCLWKYKLRCQTFRFVNSARCGHDAQNHVDDYGLSSIIHKCIKKYGIRVIHIQQ